MLLPTKLFHQYTKGGDYLSADGWKIVPDPLSEDGDNMRQAWRLISPVGKQIAEATSPHGIHPLQFEVKTYSFFQLQRETLGGRLSIDQAISKTSAHQGAN